MFDVIVVGAGHAGIEAAHVCAVRNLRVLLITGHVDMIGHMSCNPAIGGVAKGNIVREIDALGGVMGRLIDATGIHFRMLNRSKGMAVWGPRAQADKHAYRSLARSLLERQPTLRILQGLVKEVRVETGKVRSVVTESGEEILAKTVILAMGTFLNGIIHIGLTSYPGGRSGEPPSEGLTEALLKLGIESGRLKTGTPPRIDARTVDYGKLEAQAGDDEPWPFSFTGESIPRNSAVCWVARTNNKTHEIIRANLDRSPLYAGRIKSVGPRYCPSIEDKVVRFGDREGHTLFLEPEGKDVRELYLNGLSTSLPIDVQRAMVHSVVGLETAEILRPGYGIEYDYFQPVQLRPTLESKNIGNLFFAGQINGTSGYEEAACQGLIAGINAAESVVGGESLVLGREQAYTGVLIDDLVTKGTSEPYRMFTSRAEFRLRLRQDNADERLMPEAVRRGTVSQELFDRRLRTWDEKRRQIVRLGQCSVTPPVWVDSGGEALSQAVPAAALLRRPGVAIEAVLRGIGEWIDSKEVRAGVEADIKYAGFLHKQDQLVERMRKNERVALPVDINYQAVEGLLTDSRAKLESVQPATLGQAARIPGVTPADIAVLMMHVRRTCPTHHDVSRETADQ